jgi:hypothetical protein
MTSTSYNPFCDAATTQSNGACGSLCGDYCSTMMTICAGMYPDLATCMFTCNTFPTTVTKGYIVNSNLQENWQDNVACRTYHGALPSFNAPNGHCPHAYVTGGGACPNACDAYCRLMLATCPNNLEVPGDTQATCAVRCKVNFGIFGPLTVANQWNFSDPNIKSGCSIDCRVYHLLNAIASDARSVHCPHAWIHAPEGTPCICPTMSFGTTAVVSSSSGLVITFVTLLAVVAMLLL